MATANTSNIQLVHRHFLSEKCVDHLNQGFPTWGTCTPRGTFADPKGYIQGLQ